MARLEPDLKGKGQKAALAAIDADINNIRVASRWAVRQGELMAACSPVRSLWVYYDIRGLFHEAEAGFRWAAEELERTPAAQEGETLTPRVVAAYVRAQQAWFCHRLGRFDEAQRLVQPSLAILRAAGAWQARVDALHRAGAIARLRGDYGGARDYFEEMLQLANLTGDDGNAKIAKGDSSLTAAVLGRYEEGAGTLDRHRRGLPGAWRPADAGNFASLSRRSPLCARGE